MIFKIRKGEKRMRNKGTELVKRSKKEVTALAAGLLGVGAVGGVSLAGMIGVSTSVATKIINIIDTASNIALIISLIAVIVGAGVVTTGLVAAAKKNIAKFGKKYAITW